jgi:hypothetical protein
MSRARKGGSYSKSNKVATRIYQQFNDQISRLKKRKEECVSACVEQQLEVARLQLRKMRQQGPRR